MSVISDFWVELNLVATVTHSTCPSKSFVTVDISELLSRFKSNLKSDIASSYMVRS